MFTGTNAGSGGIGNAVRVDGFESWTIDEEGFIAASLGSDDAEVRRLDTARSRSGTCAATRGFLTAAQWNPLTARTSFETAGRGRRSAPPLNVRWGKVPHRGSSHLPAETSSVQVL
jgi:hypothetical protein